ncbi:MAG TPA: hypothetical protein VMH91_03020 [Candidatus Paceibacterota bacterium]|nr:hypothetical protein [Candidatus Paceibacterota bacterium]
MPEDTKAPLKYYPVLARILLLLGGLPMVTFRTSVVTARNLTINNDLIHRFVTEYKGPSHSSCENEHYVGFYRDKSLEALERKARKLKRFKNQTFEPVVEIEIDLRGVMPTLVDG